MLHARCVLCVSAGLCCSAILWRLRVLCGWGGRAPALAAARWWRCLRVVPPPSASTPSHFGTDGLCCPLSCAAGRCCSSAIAGAAVALLLPTAAYPRPGTNRALWGCCTLEQFSSGSRAVAGSNCGATAALSLQLSAACPCPVSNQVAIGVTPGLSALLVVRGLGPGARPPMGGLLSCLAAPRPPWLADALGGAGPWHSLPFWGGGVAALPCCLRSLLGALSTGRAMLCYAVPCLAVLCSDVLRCVVLCCSVLCCAVLCRAVPCRAVLCRAVLCCVPPCCGVGGGGRRTILYPARRWWYTRKRGFLAWAACLLAGRGQGLLPGGSSSWSQCPRCCQGAGPRRTSPDGGQAALPRCPLYPLALWVLLEGRAQALRPLIGGLLPCHAAPNRCRERCRRAGPGLCPASLPGGLDGCVVLCCVVLCCAVLCCVVLCCVVPNAVTKKQWPGCLPTGTGKREGCVYSACAVCKCVDVGRKRGVGETWRSPTRRLLSTQKLPLHSLSLRLLVAGAAPATPTPSCCLGSNGPSAMWYAPWRGRTRL